MTVSLWQIWRLDGSHERAIASDAPVVQCAQFESRVALLTPVGVHVHDTKTGNRMATVSSTAELPLGLGPCALDEHYVITTTPESGALRVTQFKKPSGTTVASTGEKPSNSLSDWILPGGVRDISVDPDRRWLSAIVRSGPSRRVLTWRLLGDGFLVQHLPLNTIAVRSSPEPQFRSLGVGEVEQSLATPQVEEPFLDETSRDLERWTQVKLLLLGEENVGKTALATRLRGLKCVSVIYV